MRTEKNSFFLLLCFALTVLHCHPRGLATGKIPDGHPYNVLFIPVDDLNHWVGAMGRNKQVITPHLDQLAASGVLFSNAYCAAPACNPSRAALMTGLRPASTGIYANHQDWRPHISPELTLPSFFRSKGYEVLGGGKIYHGGFDRDAEFDFYFRGGRNEANRNITERGQFGGIKWAQMNAGDDALNDYHVVSWAISELGKSHDKPFFLGCGIFRPHMPWNVPQQYYDLYPLDKIALPPYRQDDLDDLPEAGKKMALALKDFDALQQTADPELEWKKAVRAYLACISYADAQIGRLLDALDKSPYKNNTIVVLWGDHGWHLNEKNHWRKFALWEEATRSPLMYRVPGVTKPGGVCYRTVDLMSVYPTLAELCGFRAPQHVEGRSIVPLLQNPKATWEHPALTTHGFQNHAVRSEGWRYIRYEDGSEELYDENKDPYEWNNLAGNTMFRSQMDIMKSYLPVKNAASVPGERGAGRE